jgi:hypothetical protein
MGSYIFVYVSGRTDAHYFMLLIVPASVIAGHYMIETALGKIALATLFIYIVIVNVQSVRYYKKVYTDMEAASNYMKSNSSSNDFILVAGFGNQYLHVVADRLSPTRFVMPLLENNGYTAEYRKILSGDLSAHPPLFIVLNKNNYHGLNANDFYTRLIKKKLKGYSLGFGNDRYLVYKRDNQLAGPIK